MRQGVLKQVAVRLGVGHCTSSLRLRLSASWCVSHNVLECAAECLTVRHDESWSMSHMLLQCAVQRLGVRQGTTSMSRLGVDGRATGNVPQNVLQNITERLTVGSSTPWSWTLYLFSNCLSA